MLKASLLLGISFFLNAGSAQNISQIYGGGGGSGAVYNNDFVELFNPTPFAVDLTGWSVQYISAQGAGTWIMVPLGTSTLQPYHYYLVQLFAGGSTGISLPAPDVTGTVNMSATAGKVALRSNTTPLTGLDPTGSGIVDLVGYGGSASDYEGSGPASGIFSGSNTSFLRKNGGLTDSNDNANDFTIISPPIPRNSSSPANPPPATAPVLALPAYAASQFTFNLTGTTSSNYVVQATTNLAAPDWIPIFTNASPFTFTDLDLTAPQKFYRATTP